MAINSNISFDITPLNFALADSPKAVKKGTSKAFNKIKLSWLADARDEAPVEWGNLQHQIVGNAGSSGVMLTDNAVNGGFNYAYYQHEILGDNYLDRTIDEDVAKQVLERELMKALYTPWRR